MSDSSLQYGFPYDAQENEDGTFDREFDSEDWRKYFKKFIGNGVYAKYGNTLQVTADNATMFVKVNTGACFIEGAAKDFDTETSLRVANSDPLYNRYDNVVAQLDIINRTITIEVIQGTASSNPIAPAVVQNNDKYQLLLATVYVPTGVTKLSQTYVTDKRASSLCGWVSGTVNQIDATSFFDQYTLAIKQMQNTYDEETEEYYEDYQARTQAMYEGFNAAWTEWFSHIQGSLDEDTAGALQAQIDQLKYIYAKDETLFVPSTFNSVTSEVLTIGTI